MANIKGTTAADQLKGTVTADTLSGVAGDDKLEGLAGNDLLLGGLGADELIGGSDTDTASYSAATVGFIASLANSASNTGEAAGDTYNSIENLTGSAKNDELVGDGNANKLIGNAGNDTLRGGNGIDTLDGGAGDDLLEGSVGADIIAGGAHTAGIGDTITYAASAGTVTIDLNKQGAYSATTGLITGVNAVAQTGGDAAGDLLSGIENVIGSAGIDKITGDATDNIIEGADAADALDGGKNTAFGDTASYASDTAGVSVTLDTFGNFTGVGGHSQGDAGTGFENIRGGSGIDELEGNASANKLEGGSNNDFLAGAGGADYMDGGAGTDSTSYSSVVDAITILLGKSGVVTTVSSKAGNHAAGDKLVNIEAITGGQGKDVFTGSDFAVQLTGNVGDDTLTGSSLNDVLTGGDGNDTFVLTTGVDTISGGNINQTTGDVLSAANLKAGVKIDLEAGTAGDGATVNSTISGIENVIGSKQNDILIGDGGVNKIIGGTGTDIIEGSAGADILDGGALAEGNTLGYAGDTVGVTVELKGALNAIVGGAGSDAVGDQAKNFLHLIGGSGIDKLTGDGGNNVIEGGDGADVLSGGLGNDTVSYASDAAGVTLALDGSGAITGPSGGHASGDSGAGFENIRGGFGKDELTGNALANTLEGGAGNDTLIGGAGIDVLLGGADDDTLNGGAGGDTLTGGAGFDFADYSAIADGVTVVLGKTGVQATVASKTGNDAAGDKLTDVEKITGGAGKEVLTGSNFAVEFAGLGGIDKLTGSSAADSLDGGDGDDTILLTLGPDIIAGGNHDTFGDTLSAASMTTGVVISYLAGAAKLSDGTLIATFGGIENVTGSAKDDIIVSESFGANLINGGAGIDTISYAGSAGGVTIELTKQWTVNATTGAFTGTAAVIVTNSGGDKLANFENAVGGDGADTVTGDAKDNVIEGGFGADTMIGGTHGKLGDTLSYASSAVFVNVALNATGDATITSTGSDADGDKASGFENILGSIGNDILTGSSVANILQGGDGNDTLAGGLGADKLIGGNGIDTADYSASVATIGVTINLSKQGTFVPATGAVTGTVAQVGGDAAGDVLSSIENVIGSGFSDLFTGSAGANKFTGGGGALDTVTYIASTVGLTVDMIAGANGTGEAKGDTFATVERVVGTNFNDTLVAANTDTILDGGTGDDTLVSGDGADILVGGLGTDTVSYLNATAFVSVDLSIIQGMYNATTGAISPANPQHANTGGDVYYSIENVTGSSFGDILKGSSGANRLDGGTGDDDLQGGLGDDFLEGGDGLDTANYSAVTGPVTANLATHKATGAGIGTDTLSNVEGLTGTNHGDTLTGDEFDNILDGGDGDDSLDGGAGADQFKGGNGTDTLTYVSAASGVKFSLVTPANSEGDAAGDTFTDIEIILGSNFADDIEGDGSSNILQGGKGNDIIDGAGNSDTLEGGDGDDILIGGAGGDTLKGGAGEDTASYETVGGSITVTLGVGGDEDAFGDTYESIENLTGSKFDDELTGNSGDNVLTGGAGADTLTGEGGVDTLNYDGSNAAVTVAINDVDGGTGGHAQGDKSFGMENLIGSGFDDALFGDNLANTLTGGLGDDTLYGAGGNDLLDGGAGIDIARYLGATNGVSVNLGTNSATGGIDVGTDKLASIENVIGSDHNDTIIGNNNVNVIDGGKGNDTLTGGESGDTFIIRNTDGKDTVTDFNTTLDVLDFSGTGITDFTTAYNLSTYDGFSNTTSFDFGGANELVLTGVFKGLLTEANFAFAPTDLSIDVEGQNDVTVGEALGIGASVGALIGKDDHDSGEALIYKIEADPSGLFDIKNDQLVLKAALDFENGASHAIKIRVYDSSGASYGETLTVNVTDANDAPTDILIDEDTITEIASIGDLVGTLSAIDQDVPANTFTYTLIDDAGGLFALDGDKIEVAGTLDFEGAQLHTITVKVDDGEGGSFTRNIDINVEDAVEGFGVDGYIWNASVFYDANGNEAKDLGEKATTTNLNGEFALASGGSGDLVLIGGTDISTGFAFHGIMKAPNTASVITPLTTLWAYLEDQYSDLSAANAATLTALGITGPINLNTYDPVTAALSADTAISGPGGSHLKSAMQVQHTIALLAGVLFFAGAPNYADDAAEALAKTIFDDSGIEKNFGDLFFMQTLLNNAESISGYDLSSIEDDAADVMAAIGAAIEAASGTGLPLVEYLAQIAAVIHLAASDFEEGDLIVANYTGGALADLIDNQNPLNVQGLNKAEVHNGTADADTISGFGGADELNGLVGNDVLDGGEGDDELDGGDGRDVLIGGTGSDVLDGGGLIHNNSGDGQSDFDIVSYAYSTAAVTVDLGKGSATETNGADTITHVEGIIGSAFKDVLTGGANDFIETFQGGGEDDKIDGGTGLDRAIYSDATNGLAVNLAAGSVTAGGVGTDTLLSVEEIVGTSFSDNYNAAGFGVFSTNVGSRGTYNSFRPGGGDDLIIGNGNTQLDYSDGAHGISIDLATGVFKGGVGFGTDTFTGVNRVRGTAFDDTLTGGQDAYGQPGVSEVYTGGGGNDKINGGSGFDIANYAFAADTYVGGIVVNMAAGIVTGNAVQVGTDTLRGVEGIIGTAEADSYDGTGFSTTSVNAAAFNTNIDEFEGGAGNDIIKGSGSTRISYISATVGITVDLSKGLNVGTTVAGNDSVGVDTLQGGIMSVRGTRFDDKLIGFDNGTDTAQFFEVADGNDIIDGRGGYDIVSYLWDSSVKAGIRANLSAGTVVGIGGTQDNLIIGTDTLLGVEGVRGTAFADIFDATGFSTTTGANKASLSTKAGTTTGFNTFEGGGGNDIVIGNGGTRVEYGAATSGVVVTLFDDNSGKGTATGNSSVGFDTYNGGVANIRGSSYDDVLTGNKNFNSIEGKGGNDIIRGGVGNDKLDGGEYMDGVSASGMNDFDWLDYSSSTAGVTVSLYSFLNGPDFFLPASDGLKGTDATHGFEAVLGSKFNDNFTGGLAVFEIFQGGGGDDTIWGIGGMDIASYIDATAGMTFNLAQGLGGTAYDFKVTGSGVGTDSLRNIEGIYGTAFDDTFNAMAYTFGSTGTNFFRGGAGNDTIIGNANATMVVGRTIIDYSDATAGMTINLTLGKVDGSHADVGIDTFSGVNAIIGTNFNDVLIGGQADRNSNAFALNSGRFEVFDGGKGNDFIDGGSGFDYAVYDRGLGALQTKGIHVLLADGIVIGDADVFGTDTLRGVEMIVGTQLDDIFDARGFGLSSTNYGYNPGQYGLIPVIDEVPGAYNEFQGGAGNDLIYGNGYTLLNYMKATAGLVADLNLATNAIVGKNASVGTDSIGAVGQVRSIIATDYADIIIGNAFDNYIEGGHEKVGGTGDIINGGAGNDFIGGGNGDDKITGGTGDDLLSGGSGSFLGSTNADTFYFEAGHGSDTIFDFNLVSGQSEHDVIVLEGIFSSFAELMTHVQYQGSFTYIDTDGVNDKAGDVIIINTPGPTAYVPKAQDFLLIP